MERRAVVAADRWVPLAEIARAHGVRGEVRLRPFNPDSDLLFRLREVLLRCADGKERELGVESARPANDAILMKLSAVNDRDRAAELRGALVCGRRAHFPPLGEGEFYACDVEGARVVVEDGPEPPPSREVGRVITLRSGPCADVLVVEALDGGRPWEVPLVSHVVRSVDVAQGVVTLASMEGVERE
jgi:16S rRNA processing protein RimM